jgi:hypothetical protein
MYIRGPIVTHHGVGNKVGVRLVPKQLRWAKLEGRWTIAEEHRSLDPTTFIEKDPRYYFEGVPEHRRPDEVDAVGQIIVMKPDSYRRCIYCGGTFVLVDYPDDDTCSSCKEKLINMRTDYGRE